MNKALFVVVLISSLLLIEACVDKGKTYKDGEEWNDNGVQKKCKLYKVGQGLIEVIETAGSGGDAYGGGSAGAAQKTGPRQAVFDGLTYQNTDAELNPLGRR